MNNILFVNCAVYLPGEHALKRTMYLFEMMHKANYKVHFLTADFNHYSKEKRDIEHFYSQYPQYKDSIEFISVPAYEKNISVGRFWSNYLFEKQVMKWLEAEIGNYTEIYLSIPTIYLSSRIGKICREHNVKLVIDVNDLWPEAYKLLFKNDTVYKILTYPLKMLADKGYANADCIIAVSDEYRNRALQCNHKNPISRTVYLGAMLERFDRGVAQYAGTIQKAEKEFWIGYAGTIGSSYDLKTVIDAIRELHKKGYHNIRFKIMGQGPDEVMLKKHVEECKIAGVDFLGFLDYEMMAAYLSKCDLTANCLKKRASQSVINKVSDYLAAGAPIINSCVSQEMQSMIESYEIGMNYEAENTESAVNAILSFYLDGQQTKQICQNCRRLAEEKFDREKTHRELAELLNGL